MTRRIRAIRYSILMLLFAVHMVRVTLQKCAHVKAVMMATYANIQYASGPCPIVRQCATQEVRVKAQTHVVAIQDTLAMNANCTFVTRF